MPVNLTAKGTPQVEKRRRSSSTLSDDVCLGDISLDDDTKSRLRKRKKEKKSRKNKAKKANAPTHGKKKKKKQKKRKEWACLTSLKNQNNYSYFLNKKIGCYLSN